MTEIAGELGCSRQKLAVMVRQLRRRGYALTPRPNAWADREGGRG